MAAAKNNAVGTKTSGAGPSFGPVAVPHNSPVPNQTRDNKRRSSTGRTATPKPESRRTIGEAARQAEVHVETIRYYERLGLIAQPKSVQGYREYSAEDVQRLRFIKRAQGYGFSLREIGELAGMADAQASCDEMCSRMERKVAELDTEIARLTALRNDLHSLVNASPRTGRHTNCAAFGELAGLDDCENKCQ